MKGKIMLRSRTLIVLLAFLPVAALGSITWHAWGQCPTCQQQQRSTIRITPFPKAQFYTPPAEPFYTAPSEGYYTPPTDPYYAPTDFNYYTPYVPYAMPSFTFTPPPVQTPKIAPTRAPSRR
jgi:hypothetical protein